jgi:hypothetical protein
MISTLVDLLGAYYSAGDFIGLEVIASSMLATIPDDLVGLLFLALALHFTGRSKEARNLFGQTGSIDFEALDQAETRIIEPANAATYREAIRPGAHLADGWLQIAQLLGSYGFTRQAEGALRSWRSTQRPTERRSLPSLS